MSKKSIHGLTKGTELEKTAAMLAQGEAKGAMMYYALANLAREQGWKMPQPYSRKPRTRRRTTPVSTPR